MFLLTSVHKIPSLAEAGLELKLLHVVSVSISYTWGQAQAVEQIVSNQTYPVWLFGILFYFRLQ